MGELVSVIIPVYNQEQYVCECIESVLAQTYPDYEILLIDDGSMDKSLEICKDAGKKDKRIRILTQVHSGVSAARNRGIQEARGKYLFFLDSDDLIHPKLLETLCQLQEKNGTVLAAGKFYRAPGGDFRIPEEWECTQVCAEDSFCIENSRASDYGVFSDREMALYGIGGKMILRTAACKARFNERLTHGEDTMFLYQLIANGADISFLCKPWYYYRQYRENTTNTLSVQACRSVYAVKQYMRDQEIENGRMENAAALEETIVNTMIAWYEIAHDSLNKRLMRYIRFLSAIERDNLSFYRKSKYVRLRFYLLSICPAYELYHVSLNLADMIIKMWANLWRIKQILGKIKLILEWLAVLICRSMVPDITDRFDRYETKEKGSKKEMAELGILTFHCADNYGAMLQAYGLKTYLCHNGIRAEIVCYEPPYMTGRHWWFPYVPIEGTLQRRKQVSLYEWRNHRRMGKDFFRLRANMRRFRRRYLVKGGFRRILFSERLRYLRYPCYIVGSDQIWNPDITCGFRKPYFGAFKNRWKKKVVAYAASIGGAALPDRYDKEFSELLKHVDVISVREEGAIPYIKRFYGGNVCAVMDPVFFLRKREWEQIENQPEQEGYILVYTTEANQRLVEYVKMLSEEKELPVIELRIKAGNPETGFHMEYTAGPAEFLGYIHKAEYIITSSFHMIAFSILYEKQFLVFAHSHLGERTQNLLHVHGLEGRMYREDGSSDIDAPIDWHEVKKRTEKQVQISEDFLKRNIFEL